MFTVQYMCNYRPTWYEDNGPGYPDAVTAANRAEWIAQVRRGVAVAIDPYGVVYYTADYRIAH